MLHYDFNYQGAQSMKTHSRGSTRIKLISSIFVLISGCVFQAHAECPEILKYTASKLGSSERVDFCSTFAGKPLLVVNTASQCGFTPQFKQLESLHKKMGAELAIVGFPSDDFKQEYDDAEKVAEVCFKNYGVTFTMLNASSVTGKNANEFYKRLIDKTGQEPSWNFNKYLISADGAKVTHLGSRIIGEPLERAIANISSPN